MRTLTMKETQYVGAAKAKTLPYENLPGITVTATVPAACSTGAQANAFFTGFATGVAGAGVIALGEEAAGLGPEDPAADGAAAATLAEAGAKGAREAMTSQYAKCLMARQRGLHRTEIP